MKFIHYMPWWLRMVFPKGLVWQGDASEQAVYLTFDDGPHPVATPFVLDALAKYNMRATFFCIGKNVAAYPEIYARILAEGHSVGNHTMHHAHAKQVAVDKYVADVQAAAKLIDSQLFRPPYGRIDLAHATALEIAFPGIKIVMWSVLSGDFDTSLTGAYCFNKVKNYTKPGAIIVFHDSQKAMERLQVALPKTLAWLQENGLTSYAL